MEVQVNKEILGILHEVLDYMEDANSALRTSDNLVLGTIGTRPHNQEVYDKVAEAQRVQRNDDYALKHRVENLIKQLEDECKGN